MPASLYLSQETSHLLERIGRTSQRPSLSLFVTLSIPAGGRGMVVVAGILERIWFHLDYFIEIGAWRDKALAQAYTAHKWQGRGKPWFSLSRMEVGTVIKYSFVDHKLVTTSKKTDMDTVL